MFAIAIVMAACVVFMPGCYGETEGSSRHDGAPGAGGSSTVGTTASQASSDSGETSGPAYQMPLDVSVDAFNDAAATKVQTGAIDTTTASSGYIGAYTTNTGKTKLQVLCGEMSYNYDMPTDGSPIFVPLNMGDGAYSIRIMLNTSGTSYVDGGSVNIDVQMSDQFQPFLHPNVFCNYTADSQCVKKARELAEGCENEGDVARSIYEWVVDTIEYDKEKAAELAGGTGYVPDPDDTLLTSSGICFDYASLVAAMFRSLGIPCQIVTGYVSPEDLYHAWNMIYIDGSWRSVEISIVADQWCRIDTTFAAAGAVDAGYVGDGSAYTERYVY